jgi:Transposase DDE domain
MVVPWPSNKIGLKIGAVLGRHRMAKHFELTITDRSLDLRRDDVAIAKEAALDGFYVLRTSLPAEPLDAEATVLAYKSLAQVERAFRSLKTVDLEVRPVHHRLAGRVRAHVFLCTLAYYVTWHMRQELAPLLFEDHDHPTAVAARSSPVAAARVSLTAAAKAVTKRTAEGRPSWRSLLQDLATLTRNTVRLGGAPPVTMLSRPTPLQQDVFDRLAIPL